MAVYADVGNLQFEDGASIIVRYRVDVKDPAGHALGRLTGRAMAFEDGAFGNRAGSPCVLHLKDGKCWDCLLASTTVNGAELAPRGQRGLYECAKG